MRRRISMSVGDAFYRLVEAQESRTLSANSEVHVFDHEGGSYLQEAEWCRRAFQAQPIYEYMPVEDRKLVAGWGERTSGFFGRMGGAGHFKNLVLEQPELLGSALDQVPLDGPVSRDDALRYLEQVLSLRGVGLAVATRLLCVKRPDVFLTANKANARRIREVFGSFPSTPNRYLDLHERIWALSWCSVPKPHEPNQRRVWKARVGLLDALLYEAI